MRHAKSDWSIDAADFDRPLNERGRRAAEEMGARLKDREAPDVVLCSPASRARQTIERVFLETGWRLDHLRFEESLYLASLGQLLEICRVHRDDARASLMLVGHNPGLEELLEHLCADAAERTSKGKLLTTANVARVEIDPGDLERRGAGRLIELMRPQ